MNPGKEYKERIRVDEAKFREFLYSSEPKTQTNAINALWGMMAEIGGVPPFVSVPEVHGFFGSASMENRKNALLMLKCLIAKSENKLPPFISTAEFVELLVDSASVAARMDNAASFNLRNQIVQTLTYYLAYVPDSSSLISSFREKMNQDIDVERKETLLRLSEWYMNERRGHASKEIFSILNIALNSPEFGTEAKLLALEMVDQLIEQDVDVRKMKKSLKKHADGGGASEVTRKAQRSYIEAYRRGFNKPPNWFAKKCEQFKRWRRGKRNTIPASAPPEKLKRIS